MDLLRSDFIHRIRRLPQKRRFFLLDVLEQGKRTIEFINHNPLYERYSPKIFRPLDVASMRKRQKKEAKLALQMVSVSVWLLLDNPQERNLEQTKYRIREIDRLVMYHRFYDVYEATGAKIEGNIYNETSHPFGEKIPEIKQKEYENRVKEYIRLNAFERQKFITEIQCSAGCNNKKSVQFGRQREG